VKEKGGRCHKGRGNDGRRFWVQVRLDGDPMMADHYLPLNLPLKVEGKKPIFLSFSFSLMFFESRLLGLTPIFGPLTNHWFQSTWHFYICPFLNDLD